MLSGNRGGKAFREVFEQDVEAGHELFPEQLFPAEINHLRQGLEGFQLHRRHLILQELGEFVEDLAG